MEIRDKMLSVLQPLGGKEEVEELRDKDVSFDEDVQLLIRMLES